MLFAKHISYQQKLKTFIKYELMRAEIKLCYSFKLQFNVQM